MSKSTTTTGFKPRTLKFTLKDIGSEIIDQLSTDVYSGPGAVLRELVKNAYDSYLGVDIDDLADEAIERQVVISRDRNSKGFGRLIVADQGMGLTTDELKAFVQISLCSKQKDLENATGFRGLGSWAVLGGGARVIITSNKRGHSSEGQLTIDVRRIYSQMGPATTLDQILNDAKSISFKERPSAGDRQGTVVEVVCDGPAEKVKGHELNRLYAYTDPDEKELKELLVQTCPIPFSSEGGAYKRIRDIYPLAGYIPTQIVLDGVRLERGLPDDLPEPEIHDIMIGNKVAAKAWVTTPPKYTGVIKGIVEDKHLLGGSSIQLMKLNVPIGRKGIYSDGIVRATILNWFVGEVHILVPEVQPDASGQDLRAGTAREQFREALQAFYKKLQNQAERKSEVISMVKKLRHGIQDARAIEETPSIGAQERVQKEARIATAVRVIEDTGSKKKAETAREQRQREAAREPEVQKVRTEARKFLKQGQWMNRFAATTHSKSSRKGLRKRTSRVALTPTDQLISLADLQSRLGRAVPRLGELGLSQEEIQEVLEIISELLSVE